MRVEQVVFLVFTCGSDNITGLAAKSPQLEAPGEREVGGQLDRLAVCPDVNEIILGPAICLQQCQLIIPPPFPSLRWYKNIG